MDNNKKQFEINGDDESFSIAAFYGMNFGKYVFKFIKSEIKNNFITFFLKLDKKEITLQMNDELLQIDIPKDAVFKMSLRSFFGGILDYISSLATLVSLILFKFYSVSNNIIITILLACMTMKILSDIIRKYDGSYI